MQGELPIFREMNSMKESAPLCVVAKWNDRPICLPVSETIEASWWFLPMSIPMPQGRRKVTEYLVGDKWIDSSVWKAAERANMAGKATQEQMDLLEAGHWLAK